MTDQSHTTAPIRETLERAIADGARAVITYLDTARLITPYSISEAAQGEMLAAYDETGNRVRQFRLAFIRAATVVERNSPGRPAEMEEAQRVTVYLDASMIERVDALAGPNQRGAWIRAAIEQRLAREQS